jgi:formimidoylglutamate deiminase
LTAAEFLPRLPALEPEGPMRTYLADMALLPQGWADHVLIEVEPSGNIASVAVGAPPGDAERIDGIVVPGMVDLHSHAFQRALAGLTQRLGADEASFWTWRDTMYAFARQITPDEQRAIAAQLYIELLKGGYTSVVEFHYLHHQPDGRAYDEPAAMSLAIHEAALETRIALTLLPVVYMQAGVDGSALAGAQRRFALDPEGWARLAGALDKAFADDANHRVGLALHSVRAVPQAAIGAAVAAARSQLGQVPIHIHIAEQPKEVRDCLERLGLRPLQLLGEAVAIDQHWCLVHATHLTDAELALVAERQAVVGLCPSTEADLGDGLFPLVAFVSQGGRYGVGSDSNMATDAAGELRLLEQGQRLAHLRRAAAASEGAPHCGSALWSSALLGGAKAAGRPVGRVAPGFRADLVVLDPQHPSLYGRKGDLLLDSHLFGPGSAVRDVMVGGSWSLRDGHHAAEGTIADAYRRTLARLLA